MKTQCYLLVTDRIILFARKRRWETVDHLRNKNLDYDKFGQNQQSYFYDLLLISSTSEVQKVKELSKKMNFSQQQNFQNIESQESELTVIEQNRHAY